jgi:hypothetical protein
VCSTTPGARSPSSRTGQPAASSSFDGSRGLTTPNQPANDHGADGQRLSSAHERRTRPCRQRRRPYPVPVITLGDLHPQAVDQRPDVISRPTRHNSGNLRSLALAHHEATVDTFIGAGNGLSDCSRAPRPLLPAGPRFRCVNRGSRRTSWTSHPNHGVLSWEGPSALGLLRRGRQDLPQARPVLAAVRRRLGGGSYPDGVIQDVAGASGIAPSTSPGVARGTGTCRPAPSSPSPDPRLNLGAHRYANDPAPST